LPCSKGRRRRGGRGEEDDEDEEEEEDGKEEEEERKNGEEDGGYQRYSGSGVSFTGEQCSFRSEVGCFHFECRALSLWMQSSFAHLQRR